MKKTIVTIMIMVTIFIVGFVSGISFLKNHIYSRDGIITEINTETNEVIWVDGADHWWIIEGIEDWMIGDRITVINFDMLTDSIEDDYTIEYRYSNR